MLQCNKYLGVAFLGDAAWMCPGRQKVWSNMWPSAGLLPNEGYGLAGPIHRRKHPGIRTPHLDPKAPNLLPASKGLDENRVGCPRGRSVGSRAHSLLRRGGTKGTLLREGAAGWC